MPDLDTDKVDYKRTKDSARIFAEHLAKTRFENLPQNVVTAAKGCILDTLACSIAGTSGPEIPKLLKLAASDAGRPESSIIGGGTLKLPAASAVMVNAATVHQDDFDDTNEYAPSHPTSASLAPALAVAEAVGNKTGKDLILAVALSNDLTSRLSRVIKGHFFDYPWFRPPVVGIFGATAAAAIMLAADAEQHYQALGLTLPMVAGTWASMNELTSSLRSIRDGLAYRNGVLAARLAMEGFRGEPNAFDGRFGFFQAYFSGCYRPDDLVAELGIFNETVRITLKPWPSIKLVHNVITPVLEIMKKHDLEFDDIAKVEFEVGKINEWRCYPVKKGLIPDNRIDVLKNLPFAVAAAIRHKGLPLAVYRQRELADEVIDKALPKISWHRTDRQATTEPWEKGRVKVSTMAGKVFEGESDRPLGHPENPMTTAQRHAKFRDCAGFAAIPVFSERANQIIDVIENLENVSNLETLFALLR